MTSVYIHCPVLPAQDYRAVLERLCPATVRNVTVHIHAAPVRIRQLKALLEAQKEFGLQRTIRFRNILVLSGVPRVTRPLRRLLSKNNIFLRLEVDPQQAPALVKPFRKLAKRGISCSLWVDQDADQLAVYEHFRSLGLPLNLHNPRYTAQTPEFLERWLNDPAAQGINTFCDIIAMLTLDTRSPNCRHASCFGTTFRVDEDLQVYACPRHMDERTCLGPLAEAETLLRSETAVQLLGGVIDSRQKCIDTCKNFSVCQGGCMLDPEAAKDCAHYVATVQRIRQALLDAYRSKDLGKVNPIVKNAILNALAFGTAFFE